MKLREGALEIGDVVQDGVPEDEVEALVGERQRLRLGPTVGDLDPELRGGGARASRASPARCRSPSARSISPSWARLSVK